MDVNATLRSEDSRFQVFDSIASFGDVLPCSTCINVEDAFGIEVDPTIPLETSVQCYLFLEGTDYCDTLGFRIIIGEIRAFDPIPDNCEPPLYWAYDNVDSTYSHHPSYEWIECNGVGTLLTMSDDQTVQINLPSGFVWQYYGQEYSQISICSNGWVTPGYTTVSTYTNYELPGTNAPANMVAVNWDDFNPTTGGNGVWYYHHPMKHCFVVEWDSLFYYGSSTETEKFEVVIFDTTVHTLTGDNVIITQYKSANRYTSSTIGIQDNSRLFGIQCLYEFEYHRGTAPIVPGRAIKFIAADPAVWITEVPKPGSTLKSDFSVSAYPNPFTGKIAFTLNGILGSSINARVYDNTGRLIRTMITNQPLSSGTILTWDGKDNQGKTVRAGIYFLQVDNTNSQSITKLILTR